jgi:hypothetical protein
MNLFFKMINPIMKLILRSPLHAVISTRIMIITFRGGLSGRQYSTPVSYFQEGDQVICFTHSPWWKNIACGAGVDVRIRGEDLRGYAVAVADDLGQKVDNLTKMMKAVPGDAAFYNVKFDGHGEPRREDIESAARDAVLIQIQIEG